MRNHPVQQSDKDDACARSKSYYKRLKADPKKWAAYIQKKVERQRERRGRASPVRNQREESSVSPEKTAPLREESIVGREESAREESPPPVGSEESTCEESPVVTAEEDALARIHRLFREECIRLGTYKGIDQESVKREEERWRKECSRPPRKVSRRRKHPPKGHAD